jgi:ribose transport system permease protein
MSTGSGQVRPIRALFVLRSSAGSCVFILVLVVVTWAAPGILRPRAMNGLLADSAPLLILVLGSTFPILLGCLDLSVAATASLSATVVAVLVPSLGSAAVPVVLCGAALVGALQGYLIGLFQIPSFVTTLGTLGIFSGIALYLSNATTIAVTADVWLFDVLARTTGGLPNVILLLVLVWLMLVLLQRYTRIGRELYHWRE